ncbi:pentatricopeptide (PPR) repeat-containing protein [Wolffia australiana]
MSSECSSFLRKLASQPSSSSQTLIKKLHAVVLKTSPPTSDPFLFNTLLTLYSKCGNSTHARQVFDQIPHRNLFSWNAILSAYSKSAALTDMESIFRSMPRRDEVSWNALIAGYANSRSTHLAIEAYMRMRREATQPNRITFSTLLGLSSASSSPSLGRQFHAQVFRSGFAGYPFVGSPLVDMYAKLGLAQDAKKVFDEMPEKTVIMHNTLITGLLRQAMVEEAKTLFSEMPVRDSISWTTLITGLAQNGLEREALDFFREMSLTGVAMDQYTYGGILSACGTISAVDQGKMIHARVVRALFEGHLFVGSALVDMYAKCERVDDAASVFRRMPRKNIVSWTAMLVGYGQNGRSEEAVLFFRELLRQGLKADDFSLGSVISSCGNLSSLEEGAQLHSLAFISGQTHFTTVSNAIVTLYGKCGSLGEAQKMFDEMRDRDQVSWTALVSGYAQFGLAKETIELFERMIEEGSKPDAVTFIGVLSACSRAGLVEKGEQLFNSMPGFGISPISDHFTCMIDLYSRAGRLKEAEKFINQMPIPPDVIGWATLLSSCRIRREMEIGRWAADSLMRLDPGNPAGYVLMVNMHAGRGEWGEVAELRKKMRARGVKKEPGCSWIKYKNKCYLFSADDRSSPFSDHIYAKLDWLNRRMEEEGYKPDTSSVLHDLEESEKVEMLSLHSEKLAIAFGLLFLPEGSLIRVVKNLRVCIDCHVATKLISKITGREILVRDAARFHLFKDGSCSCGDFW